MVDLDTAEHGPIGRLRHFLINPITIKELRGRMRGRRAFIVLTLYLGLMSFFVVMVYLLFATASRSSYGPVSRQAGKVVFGTVLSVQVFLVVFVGPAFTSASISGEKERKTFDLLRTTLLPAGEIVFGKLISSLTYILLLILASLPLLSMAFLLGGISMSEVLLSQLLILVSAVAFAQIGLYFSSRMGSTLAASITTFAISLGVTIGIPLAAVLALSFASAYFGIVGTQQWPLLGVLIYAGILLAAINLPATILLTELFLLQQDTFFYYQEIIDGHIVTIFSPWWITIILYSTMGLLFYWSCVRRVRRKSSE